MAKHQIFLIHGMGNQKDGWSTDVQKNLKDQYNQYAISKKNGNFGSHFEFVEITYNNLFEDYLKEWKEQSKNLSAWGKLKIDIGNPLVQRMTNIAQNGPGDSFLTTHIGDVLLYTLTDIRELVKADVGTQIMSALQNDATGGWSIISHSLGTRVMTDTLQMLYTEPKYDFVQQFGKASLIATIANVSYLLQQLGQKIGNESGDVYQNAVFPGKGIADGASYRWVNTAHELDPFLWAWPFVPPANAASSTGWRTAIARGYYKDIRLTARDITGSNPHDLWHYLRHPDVHQAIFQILEDASGPSIFDPIELEHERQDYYDETLSGQALKDVKDQLERLKQGNFSTVKSLLDLWEKYGNALKKN